MNKYAVVIEEGETSFGACVPDLPGCVAVAASRQEMERLLAEAITLHIESLQEHANPVPKPNLVLLSSTFSPLKSLKTHQSTHSLRNGTGTATPYGNGGPRAVNSCDG